MLEVPGDESINSTPNANATPRGGERSARDIER